MWRFKPFMHKEQAGLEGRSIDVGNLKIHVRNVIAEGGFSCVYLARDAINSSKQYALKHIICNDNELLDLVMKEISVMKSLKGHPNVVTLLAHTILDMGRTKEAILVMEFCEKSLVTVLENRGAGYFEEKQLLAIFRDVCNAVFAMHCQSPPIAHRDLKAENLLLGSDGLWKLCDFGSTSTNHKRFERPEEMGIEEDNIRKHTTPAYRAPEMWDLFLREVISEKVDIWALGCLLFRICYFKSAFDGESKLQVLNGNYRIPESPKYSSSVIDLIKDMLQASPDARPDITQVWFCVNNLLPVELQKSLPDQPPELHQTDIIEGISKSVNKTLPMPRRSPPPPPSSREPPSHTTSNPGGGGAQLGAFWSSQHAKDSVVVEEKSGPKFDEEPAIQTPSQDENLQTRPPRRTSLGKPVNKFDDGPSKDFEISFFPDSTVSRTEKSKSEKPISKNEAFNTFVTEFDPNKLRPGKEDELQSEIEKLKEQLKKSNMEKSEITSKYEKLSAICRSQRQEIQELKQALTATTPSPDMDSSKTQPLSGFQSSATPLQKEKRGGIFDKNTPSSDASSTWQAFSEDPNPPAPSNNNVTKPVRTRNDPSNKPATEAASVSDAWGFGTGNFSAVSVSTSASNSLRVSGEGNNSSQRSKNVESKPASAQPAGWAGF